MGPVGRWRMAAAAVATFAMLAGAPAAHAAVQATEGEGFSGQVATATPQCTPASASATINWGDKTASSNATVSVSPTQLTFSGSHTYVEEGSFTGIVSGSYQCPGAPGPLQFTVRFGATVADAPLQAKGASLAAVSGSSLTATVATFGDADPGGVVNDYTATINWGDGSPPSSGVVGTTSGGFAITGTHTYVKVGSYTVTVTVSDAGGSLASAQTTVQVGAATGQTLSLGPGTRFTGPVATFTPQCLLSTAASGGRATISWGDGLTSPATVMVAHGGTQLVFVGSHTYSHSGSFTGGVTGSYNCGNQSQLLPSLNFGSVISLLSTVYLRAQGIDLTQGVTDDNNPLVPSGIGAGGSYQGFGFSPPDFGNDPLPSSSPLVLGNPTVVRFYADAHGGLGGGLSGVGAVLYGSVNGVPLPGGPLFADYGPNPLPDTGEPDPAPVWLPERVSDSNTYTFTLPYAWTNQSQPITLTAELVPPQGRRGVTVCNSLACQAHREFTLSNIAFVPLPYMVIAPVAILQPGEKPLPDPFTLYSRALQTEPNRTGYIVLPYIATVDPTVVIDDPTGFDPAGDLNNGYLQELEEFAFFYYYGLARNSIPDLVAGINWDQRGVTPGGHSTYDYPAVGFYLGNATRPISSIGHEHGHYLGRNHADEPSAGCGGNGGPWPPDHAGYMQGIGLDMSTHPYKVLYPGLPGEPAEWYDKMSYCAGGADGSGWISPYGWLHSISALWLYGQKVGRAADVASGTALDVPSATAAAPVGAEASGAPSQLVVSAVLRNGHAAIESVLPATAPQPQPASSTLQLVSRDKSGHVLATTNLLAFPTHDDPGPHYFDLVGTVPAAGVGSVQLTQDGVVIATRVRPAHAPRVQILGPRRGAVVGGPHAVTLRWRASEAGGAMLMIAVHYSSDGGRHWRAIYLGPNRGHVRLPSWYFLRSRNARVRITATDGFNQTQVVSAPFTALGSPPQVVISSPLRGSRIAGDARLELAGRAFDQALAMLRGRSLRWLDGPFSLGFGTTLEAPPLPPGRNVIRLVARDLAGLVSSASIVVNVTPVDLPFLHLQLPARLGRGQHRLAFSASAAVPATLTINGHRFLLTGKRRRFSLAVRPGATALLLELTVTDDGIRLPFAARVSRS